MALKLVVGLGNPGPEYEKTRHNVGFRLADRLVGGAVPFQQGMEGTLPRHMARSDSPWKAFKGLGVAAKSGDLWVAKPMTYMNLSGEFVKQFAAYHNILRDEILVVYDELALPLGKIRLRVKGSAGGQKGMLSIISQFATEEVARLRIGIGPQPEKMDSADYVLGRFSPAQEAELEAVLSLADEAVGFVRDKGVNEAMNRYNPAP